MHRVRGTLAQGPAEMKKGPPLFPSSAREVQVSPLPTLGDAGLWDLSGCPAQVWLPSDSQGPLA